jgi:hypothetical protein
MLKISIDILFASFEIGLGVVKFTVKLKFIVNLIKFKFYLIIHLGLLFIQFWIQRS